MEWSVYKKYFKFCGTTVIVTVLTSLFLMQASKNVSDFWLGYWVMNEETGKFFRVFFLFKTQSIHFCSIFKIVALSNSNFWFYMGIYIALAVSNTLFTLLRSFSFAYSGLKAAKIFHENLIKNVLEAKFSFFDVTPG